MEAPTTEVREETCCAPDCCSDENTTPRTAEELREAVRERYANIAINRGSDCCGEGTADATSARLGYSEDELTAVPEGANLGLTLTLRLSIYLWKCFKRPAKTLKKSMRAMPNFASARSNTSP